MNREKDERGRCGGHAERREQTRGRCACWPWDAEQGTRVEPLAAPGTTQDAERKESEAVLRQTMRFMIRFRKTVRDGFAEATADHPHCHFAMLERLHYSIEQCGTGGAIGVSDIAAQMRSTAPAISRSLRVLESEGYILRAADPSDRRKTWVRLTPEGEEVRAGCEAAMQEYMQGVITRLGVPNLQRMLNDWEEVERAMVAETAARAARQHPDPEHERRTENAEDF